MNRKPRPDPKCIQCQKVVSGPLYSIQYITREGWCSEPCFDKWSDNEEVRLKDLARQEQSNVLRAQ